jgi:hypothetical protein
MCLQDLIEASKAKAELTSHVEKAMEQVIAANMQKEAIIKKVQQHRLLVLSYAILPLPLISCNCRTRAQG